MLCCVMVIMVVVVMVVLVVVVVVLVVIVVLLEMNDSACVYGCWLRPDMLLTEGLAGWWPKA